MQNKPIQLAQGRSDRVEDFITDNNLNFNSPNKSTDEDECFSCKAFDQFMEIGSAFTETLAATLQPGIMAIFTSLVTVWLFVEAIKFLLSRTDFAKFFNELFYIIIASFFMGTAGTNFIITMYNLNLSTMAKAAGLAFVIGKGEAETVSSIQGLRALIAEGEAGIGKVLEIGFAVVNSATSLNWMPIIYGLILIVPYFLLIISYLSQVVVAIFRMIMLSVLAPFLILCFGFGWGRQMAFAGIRTMLSTAVVLFAATAALSIAIYGASNIDFNIENLKGGVNLTDSGLLMAIALGWMGTALMTEGVGVANSVTQSMLSNTAAGIMTAGATGTAAAIFGAKGKTIKGAAMTAGAISNPVGGAGAIASAAQNKLSQVKDFYNAGKGIK